MNDVNDKSTAKLIDIFQAKARCSYTNRKTTQAYNELKFRLNDIELTEINVALSHVKEEGPAELDSLCRRLKQKYLTEFSGEYLSVP